MTPAQAVAEAVRRSLGAQATEITPTPGRAPSWYAVADGLPIVVKAGPMATFEAWACRAVREQGVPAPEVLAVEGAAGSPLDGDYLIMRRLGGVPLPSLDRLSVELVRGIGEVLRRVHEVPGTGFGLPAAPLDATGAGHGAHATWDEAIRRWTDSMLRRLVPEALDAATAEAIRTERDRRRPFLDDRPSTLLHGDFTPRHILVSSDLDAVTGLIDFAGAMFGPPAYDLAVFSIIRQRDVVVLAHGYASDVDERRSILWDVPFYRLVRRLAELNWAQTGGADLRRSTEALRASLRDAAVAKARPAT